MSLDVVRREIQKFIDSGTAMTPTDVARIFALKPRNVTDDPRLKDLRIPNLPLIRFDASDIMAHYCGDSGSLTTEQSFSASTSRRKELRACL